MDVLNRLFVLERASQLLEDLKRFQEGYEKRDNVEYWVFEGIVEKVSLRVIVRLVKGGEKHFYSVIKKGKQ